MRPPAERARAAVGPGGGGAHREAVRNVTLVRKEEDGDLLQLLTGQEGVELVLGDASGAGRGGEGVYRLRRGRCCDKIWRRRPVGRRAFQGKRARLVRAGASPLNLRTI